MTIGALVLVLALPGAPFVAAHFGTAPPGGPGASRLAALGGRGPDLGSGAALHDLVLSSPDFAGRVGSAVPVVARLPNGTSLAGATVTWWWGDGSSSTTVGPTAVRTYATPGLYLIDAEVTDPFGVTHDAAAGLLAVPVAPTHALDPNGTGLQLDGRILANSSTGPGATALVAPGGHVDVSARLAGLVPVPRIVYAPPSFAVPASIASDVTFSNEVLDTANGSQARVTTSAATPAGLYPLNYSVTASATVDNTTVPLAATFTFTLAVGSGLGGGEVGYARPATPGAITAYELGYGPNTLDPAIDYDTNGLEAIENVYQTLILPNGTSTGAAPSDFVPDLATCVPGSSLCTSLYGSSLISGDHYTFVLNSASRFYDPATGTSWPVYPTDVLFSIARTLAFADLPCYGCNNGWMLAQALLPTGNPGWDHGFHTGANNTPGAVFGAMSVNNSTYCPSSASSANGCLTFTVSGGGSSWPFFLELLANPLGGAIVPCGWFSAPAQGAGIPYWSQGNVSGSGDLTCPMPGASGFGGSEFGIAPSSMAPTDWDAWESSGSSPPYVGNVEWAMVGSGPYDLGSLIVGSSLTLASNPAYAANPDCTFSGCPNATGRIGNVTLKYELTTAPGLSSLENGTASVVSVSSGDGARLAADVEAGRAAAETSPTLDTDYQSFNLDYNASLFTQLTGNTTTAPSSLLTDLNLRQFLIHADPYATIQSTDYQTNGTQWRSPYGGPPFALFGGSDPANVSWAAGNPVTSTSVAGSAAWWWNLTAHDAFAGANCTSPAPCSIPLVYAAGDATTRAADLLWSQEVATLSGGAILLNVTAVDFVTLVIYSLYSGPGGNPWGIWSLGWVSDYADPSDPAGAEVLPYSAYTFSDAVAPAFAPLNQSCATSVSTWSTLSTPIAHDCQGAAYNATVSVFSAAAAAPLGPARDLLYAEGAQVWERLGLYVAAGQPTTVNALAPWIDPATVDQNPWTGGAAQVWYTVRERTNPALPLSVRGVLASPPALSAHASLTLSVALSGGTAPWTFSWSGLPPGCAGTTAVLDCAPTSGGTYSVQVTVTDALGDQATGSVVVSVSGLAISGFTATPSVLTLGSTTVLAVTLGGGISGASYTYSGLPPGCASRDLASLTCTPNATGNFTVVVAVTAGNSSATDTTSLTVLPPQPLIGAFTSSPPAIDLGDSVTLAVNGSTGTGPYVVVFHGVPGCLGTVQVSTLSGPWAASVLCTPTQTGTFVANATVTNGAGGSISVVTALAVHALPVVAAFSLLTPAVDVGTPLDLSVNITGGTAPLNVSYLALPTGCASVDATALVCTPTASGTSTVTVTVTDSVDHRATAQRTVSVAPKLAVTLFGATPASVTTGEATNLTVRTSGGTAPIVIAFAGLPGGCGSANTTLLLCRPTATGSFTVRITVVDAAGATASASTPLTVTSPTSSTAPGAMLFGLPLLEALALLGIVGVLVVVLAVVAIRGRRPATDDADDATPDEYGYAPTDEEPGPTGDPPEGPADP